MGFPPPFGDFPPLGLLVQVLRRLSSIGEELVLIRAHKLRRSIHVLFDILSSFF